MAGTDELYYDTEKLGEIGEAFSKGGEKLQSSHDEIINIKERIAKAWEGKAHTAFDIVIDSFIKAIEEVIPVAKNELGAKFLQLQSQGEETTKKNSNLFE